MDFKALNDWQIMSNDRRLVHFLYLRRREYIPNLGNVGEIKRNPMSTYIIRSFSFVEIYVYFRRKSRFKKLRGQFQKILTWLNPKSNLNSKYMHILMFALSRTLEFIMLEKSNFCNYVTWRDSGTTKFQRGQDHYVYFHIFQSELYLQLQYWHTSALKFQNIKFKNPRVTWPHVISFFDFPTHFWRRIQW